MTKYIPCHVLSTYDLTYMVILYLNYKVCFIMYYAYAYIW